jgi:hypothetical protein
MSLLSLAALTPFTTLAVTGNGVPSTAFVVAFIGFVLLLVLGAYAFIAYLLSRIFKKAGVAQWKAWVPVYSQWTMLELGGQKGWWSLLYCAGFLSLLPLGLNETSMVIFNLLTFLLNVTGSVFMYMAMYKIGLKLDKEGYFVLWAIFLPIVWYIWLAFDDSRWETTTEAAAPQEPPTPAAA